MTPPTGYLEDPGDDADGWALHYPKARIEAERAIDVPGGAGDAQCSFPTCGITDKLLRVALRRAGVEGEDLDRVSVTSAVDTCSYPAIGSVRVDDREVYRVFRDPAEVFDPEVVGDVLKALRRAA
jgi:hypothetical protein